MGLDYAIKQLRCPECEQEGGIRYSSADPRKTDRYDHYTCLNCFSFMEMQWVQENLHQQMEQILLKERVAAGHVKGEGK